MHSDRRFNDLPGEIAGFAGCISVHQSIFDV